MTDDHVDIDDGFVWLVYSMRSGHPNLLSVHTTRTWAYAARKAYIADATFGADMDDYWISGMRLNKIFVEKK